jgi:hypothetical protein
MVRDVTIVTANLGRKASISEFEDNVMRIKRATPKRGTFIGWQEIDEDDDPRELRYIKEAFGLTHRMVGTKTHVPISVPRNFEISRRIVEKASDGVKGLQPDRHVVQAVVHPEGHPENKVAHTNTHFGRNIEALKEERRQSERVLRKQLGEIGLPTWLTADLNSENYTHLSNPEFRFVTARLDYIRAYPRGNIRMRLINTGTINLVGDGHNAHWARAQITWP